MEDLTNLHGRLLTEPQLMPHLQVLAKPLPSTVRKQGRIHCHRCGTAMLEEWQLANGAYYCRACIGLGRVRSDERLFYFPQQAFPEKDYLVWDGQLTVAQEKVAQALVKAVEEKKTCLVHAVTGAGKTEMLYPLLNQMLSLGKAIALVSPRIDVCLELYQRLKGDFSCSICLLHGESEAYHRAPLLVATTHQLMKFYQAFDLVIIDEVDAFPYADNPILYHAVNQSVKADGVKVFLTATSTPRLDQAITDGKLRVLTLYRRFHGSPLVVPELRWLSNHFHKGKWQLPNSLKGLLLEQHETGYPLLLFCPTIPFGQAVLQTLKQTFPSWRLDFVSSKTEDRKEIVAAFRERKIDILISTTILERGVTFPGVDVFVLESHHRLFSKSALIQIAGRVGRSHERPTGLLYFFHQGKTKAMIEAVKTIKRMNE